MTNEEAIKLLTNATYSEEWQGNEDLTKAQHMAIEELEKQVPKKPKTERKTVDLGNGYSVKIVEIHRCPECGKTIMKGYRCYGLDCGQKIDWSDYE